MIKLFKNLALAMLAALAASALFAQVPQKPPDAPPPLFKGEREKDDDPNGRIAEGTVKDEQDNPIDGAVVKLKNTKTLQVRSFITKTDGKFRFGGLRKDIDYEVKADFKNLSSSTRTISVFDSRKQVILNLKLEPKK